MTSPLSGTQKLPVLGYCKGHLIGLGHVRNVNVLRYQHLGKSQEVECCTA
jgi:hypothetical protein